MTHPLIIRSLLYVLVFRISYPVPLLYYHSKRRVHLDQLRGSSNIPVTRSVYLFVAELRTCFPISSWELLDTTVCLQKLQIFLMMENLLPRHLLIKHLSSGLFHILKIQTYYLHLIKPITRGISLLRMWQIVQISFLVQHRLLCKHFIFYVNYSSTKQYVKYSFSN